MSADASYTDEVTENSVKGIVGRSLGLSGASIYCHNHRCEKGETDRDIEPYTVLSMMEKSPQPVPSDTRDHLENTDSDREPINLHDVPDGFEAFLLVGPSEGSGSIEVSGWYCSAECIENVVWPTEDHIAVAVELHVDHPPDIYRHNCVPSVDEIKCVHCLEPSVSQLSVTDF